MTKKIAVPVIFLFIFFGFLSSGYLLSQKNNEDAKFQKTLDLYLNDLWKFYPTSATLAGFHNYDSKLEDFSEKNLEKRHEALDLFNQEFAAKLTKTNLNPDLQIDYDMIRDALDIELLKHESLVPWEYNPIFYNEIFANCVKSLLTEEFAPIDVRAKNTDARLKELPKLVKQAKQSLKTPPQLYTETAIKQFAGIVDFYKKELPVLLDKVPADIKPKLQDSLTKAILALEDYQNFLSCELLPRSTGNFRLGEEVHTRLLRLTLQNSIPFNELIARATADVKNIRREMFLVCIPFYKIMDPKFDLEKPPAGLTEDQLYNTVISHVLDRIKTEHVTKEEYVNRVKISADDIRNFASQKQLFELPQENLNIEPMPLALQAGTWTRLNPPGVYDKAGAYTCQVTDIPADWNDEQVTSFLEEYNNFFLYFWTARRVYPGSFVPTYFTRKNPSLVRNLYPNMALLKGWPFYIGEFLVTSGFGNFDLKLRLHQLKFRLKTFMDFILELNIHSGTMEKEKALNYMMVQGFQSQAEAERKWNRIILGPCDTAFDYVGLQEILDMEKECKAKEGEAFNQQEFLKRLLSCGALPPRDLKKKILEQ
jgi:hypothetical protein